MGTVTQIADQKWNEGWHLGKRVGIPELVMTVTVVVSMVYWVARAEGRVDQNAQAIVALAELARERSSHNAADIRALRAEVSNDLEDIKKRLQSIEGNQAAQLSRIEQKVDSHLVDHSRNGAARQQD